MIAVEYTVAPSALWRDVLPTTAHRWVTQQPGDMRVFDCMVLNPKSQSIQWLTRYRVLLTANSSSDCTEPNLSQRLAATGYTHVLVTRDTAEGRWFAKHPAEGGFRVAANLKDGQVFAVTAAPPSIYTATMPGFFRREHSARGTWRWMGQDAAWTIMNTGVQPIVAVLAVELWAFQHARALELLLDGRHVQNVVVDRTRQLYHVGPLTVPPGEHALMFHSSDGAAIPDEEASEKRAVDQCRSLSATGAGTCGTINRDARLPGFLGRCRRTLSGSRGRRVHTLLLRQRAAAVHRALSSARRTEDLEDRPVGRSQEHAHSRVGQPAGRARVRRRHLSADCDPGAGGV